MVLTDSLWAHRHSEDLLERLDSWRGPRIGVLQMSVGRVRLQPMLGDDSVAPTSPRQAVSPVAVLAADGWWLRWGKRGLDIGVALISLFLLSPVILLLAGLIILTDGLPVFYRRRVVGKDFREFDAYKLRTMVRDADAVLQRNAEMRRQFEERFKLKSDPRVTPLGRLLRVTSLDELPQLVNVLKGDMSIIGPRMMTKPELQRYGGSARIVVSVRPGISGLWQVSGRQLADPEARKRYDLEYVRQASARFDLFILWRTVVVLLTAKGAW